MPGFINDFISIHTQVLWDNLTPEFGREVDYWPGGDGSQSLPLTLIWIEGTEDEEVSPGRYSHAHIRNRDLPQAPALGDALEKDGSIFDIVRVNAYATYFCTVILQERGNAV